MHHSVPIGICNGNSSFEHCAARYLEEFGEELKPITYFESGPLYLEEDGSQVESKYPLENPTAMQKQETKRLWAMANNRMAQSQLKYAFINRWLRSLKRPELIKDLVARGHEFTNWEKRTMPLEELLLLWQPTEKDLS